MQKRWKKTTIHLRNDAEKNPVPVVWDAAVAIRGVADGRIIPLLIIDTSDRPDIEDMIRAHKYLGPGDVTTGWAIPSRFDKSRILLILSMNKPSQCTVIMEFDIPRQAGVLDQIIHAQGLYIQPGRKGDRLSSTFDNDRLLVEIPSRQFQKEWDSILRKALKKDLMKKGLHRQRAEQVTVNFLRKWRQFGSRRMWTD